jgi:SAM-dependent methyltransferase
LKPAAGGVQAPPAAPRALHRDVRQYYTDKLARFGPTAMGVDWSCELTQQLRFIQLLKVCEPRRRFSINDLGCGYGALVPFLRERHARSVTAYHGVDLSPEMIGHARLLHASFEAADFHVGSELKIPADFGVASGVFNVKLRHSRAAWESFVADTLDHLHRMSSRGFAVNFLTPLPAGSADELYCTHPEPWSAWCRRELQCEVEVVARYGLSEFTLIARRPDPDGARGRRDCSKTSVGS